MSGMPAVAPDQPDEGNLNMHDHVDPETLEVRRLAYLARVRDIVAEHGWMIQAVMGGDGEPGFAYTVGLAKYNHPEFIVFALHPDTAQSVLNGVGEQVRDHENFVPGRYTTILGNDMPAHLVRCDPAETAKRLTVARVIHGGPVDALQIVWPDKERRFPWESGYELGDVQPILGTVPA